MYILVQRSTARALSEEVNRIIRQGYKPHGSPFCVISPVTTDRCFHQAMLKETESTKPFTSSTEAMEELAQYN